ncbi:MULTISPECIES: DUF6520 family protein [Leeuwenhoekiella]|jgi:hypothetical protein|uniref:Uncharacterized protein n=1 Tax=Leeuwenhoekiella blandensis (strain CECT 7118 / CCUG 51940 / KCTC 22103 / MED217) TaxID=398720 RepID=A3XR99_LEEBM|nr:DUF6520 family protein [Leeuwenhoekiella blandensis]MAM17452.1 hypothetical protein [Christiangramia sp.]MBQ51641.1 hypothetical protein [Leeuwenhoekiella sp.]EAQ47924.1 hypothetical protein MED217_13571 [Leeuwenhoekiella blandensis MED217]MAM17471.1 hypothetical protein [Christiangramia sp.]HCW63525.1 hypothetical protein [Leeuwenhoekiella sp.]|tara:strand:+ start:3344 stop:3619 length:276 start_codon:yes stop_codon:yes gene_type:complete
MKNAQRKLILPALVMGLGVFGAFVSTAHTAASFAPQTGYVENNQPCDTPVSCDTDGEVMCTLIINGEEQIARGKLTPVSDCTVPLFRPVQN